MGLVVGRWQFDGSDMPSIEAVVLALAEATRLQVSYRVVDGAPRSSIEVPRLGVSFFDIESAGGEVTFYSHVPAHPYLWENLDRVLVTLGGQRLRDETCWRPDERFRHVRRPWDELSATQRWLLRFPPVGASRLLDRFV